MSWLTALTLSQMLWAGGLLAGFGLAAEGTERLLDRLARVAARGRLAFKLVAPLTRFGLWTAGLGLALGSLGPLPEGLWALLAPTGLALGLGGQDLARNLAGGLTILWDRPFQTGDRVRVGSAYGEITRIGLRSTRLLTPDDTLVTVPNSQMVSDQVFNVNGAALPCQVVTDIFVASGSEPQTVRQVALEAAWCSPYLCLDRPVVVLVSDVLENWPALRVRVKAYVFDHRYEAQLQSDITLRARREWLDRGVEPVGTDHPGRIPGALLQTVQATP